MKVIRQFIITVVVLSLLLGALVILHSPVPGQAPERPRPGAAALPEEGVLYVWQQPEAGLQTLLVLKVLDGNTMEGAYLVPVRLRHGGALAPEEPAKGAKEAKAMLEKLLAGRLVPARLQGRDRQGALLADFYLGPADAKDKDAPNGWSSEFLVKSGLGQRPTRITPGK